MHVFSFDPCTCTLNLVLHRCIQWMCHLGQIWMGKDNRLTLFLAFFFASSWQGSIPYSSTKLDSSLSFSAARVFTKTKIIFTTHIFTTHIQPITHLTSVNNTEPSIASSSAPRPCIDLIEAAPFFQNASTFPTISIIPAWGSCVGAPPVNRHRNILGINA